MLLPDAQVMDFNEGNPALSQGLDNATAILSLICLVAMVLGAIGVAMAMHAHLEQRMDMLAILKAVGAGSADLLRIFLLQTLGLGLAGGVLGVAAGVGVMAALPAVFGKLLPVHTVLEFPWQSVAGRTGNGPADDAAVLSCRRCWMCAPSGRCWCCGGWWSRVRRGSADGWRAGGHAGCSWEFRSLVVLALGGIAWALSDSVKVGGWFALLFFDCAGGSAGAGGGGSCGRCALC